MVNPYRGEIEAILDGKAYKLCLTLGALAELELRLGAKDLLDLTSHFEKGQLSAQDVIYILCAGLKGGGHDIPPETVSQMQTKGGASGFIEIVKKLLEATFLVPE